MNNLSPSVGWNPFRCCNNKAKRQDIFSYADYIRCVTPFGVTLQVRDQECMYTNVIATAFKRVATVEEACEIYDGFKVLAKRPKIQRFLEKKAGEVWKLFLQAS